MMTVPDAVLIGYSVGFSRVSGQMYDVKGSPSTVTSTRRPASSAWTATAGAATVAAAPASVADPAVVSSASGDARGCCLRQRCASEALKNPRCAPYWLCWRCV